MVHAPQNGAGLCAVASKSHDTPGTEAYLAAIGCTERVSIGSSLKFALLAAGEADIYPRPAPTMEWDTAAGHAILAAAGGSLTTVEGKPFNYGKAAEKFANPHFVARGLPEGGAPAKPNSSKPL